MEIYRCHVPDVDQALPFYRALGFRLVDRLGLAFAVMQRSRLVVWLCVPTSGPLRRDAASKPNVNRLVIEVQDIAHLAERVAPLGARAASELRRGRGGLELLLLDPAGNPIELFQPDTGRHKH